ncbi:zinc finger protein zat2 [Fagus crenata]
MNNHLSFPLIWPNNIVRDDATVQETVNTMRPIIEIGGGSSSVTPFRSQQTGGHTVARGSNNFSTQGVHGGHAQAHIALDPPKYYCKCTVCGKPFPSDKALGGHMKVHPERPWRGLIPPPTVDQSSAALSATRGPGINLIEPQENALASARFELNVLALEAQLEKATSPKFDLNVPAPETFLKFDLNVPALEEDDDYAY